MAGRVSARAASRSGPTPKPRAEPLGSTTTSLARREGRREAQLADVELAAAHPLVERLDVEQLDLEVEPPPAHGPREQAVEGEGVVGAGRDAQADRAAHRELLRDGQGEDLRGQVGGGREGRLDLPAGFVAVAGGVGDAADDLERDAGQPAGEGHPEALHVFGHRGGEGCGGAGRRRRPSPRRRRR